MKTFDELEYDDVVYTTAFLYNEYIIVRIRKVRSIKRNRNGKVYQITFNDGITIHTEFNETDTTTLKGAYSTNISDFMVLYRQTIKEAKAFAVKRANTPEKRLKLIKNFKKINDHVKQTLHDNSLTDIKLSLLEAFTWN